MIDYGSTAMTGVWDAIEESGVAVAHHIGETGLSTPCEHNMMLVAMICQVASFREMFGKYLFTGILDRHPGLKIGWFEGGVNWVPAALQDAEHMLASLPAHDRPARWSTTSGTTGGPTCTPRSWWTRSGSA